MQMSLAIFLQSILNFTILTKKHYYLTKYTHPYFKKIKKIDPFERSTLQK